MNHSSVSYKEIRDGIKIIKTCVNYILRWYELKSQVTQDKIEDEYKNTLFYTF